MRQDLKRFLNLFMDQNNKCNLKCQMCGFSDPRVKDIPKYDMPLWLFEKIAREVFPHTRYLALSCLTEPFMTGDFHKRLDLLKAYPVPFTEIITNATLLSEEAIYKMIEVSITRLAVSIDGANASTYEAIRVGAKFHKVIRNIQLINKMKAKMGTNLPNLRLNHVITETNINEFKAFLDLAESLNTQSVDVRTVIPFRNAVHQGTTSNSFFQKIQEMRDVLSQWIERTGVEDVGYLRYQAEEIQLFDESGQKRICQKPWDSLAIHANGDVLPCITWTRPPLANIAYQCFEEIWNGTAIEAVRQEFKEQQPGVDCQHCVIKKNVPFLEDDDCFFLMLNKIPPKRHF